MSDAGNSMEVPTGSRRIRFGVFEVDLRAGELRKHGLKVKLQEQPFEVLAMMLEHPGEVVTREELRQKLWAGDTFVDFDVGLNTAIKKLRHALADSAESPRFVETLPRRGYRFIAPVQTPSASALPEVVRPAEGEPASTAIPASRLDPLRHLLLAMAALTALVVALLAFNVGGWRDRLLHPGKQPRIESIAVLPLENLSGDPAQDYFADGMTDELITDLAKISSLRVVSRTSVMRYKGTKEALPQIAHELGVDAVVEGAVVHSAGRVRITAQLVQASTDRHLWADSYERDLGDVLTLQEQVTRAIASQIQIKLTPQEQTRLASARPVNPDAYEAYLRGRYYWNRGTAKGLKKASDYFENAINLNPAYALAYAGLADSYTLLPPISGGAPKEAFAKARAAAMKAVEIDDTVAEAHASLVHIMAVYDFDWTGAEREFKRALELNPNYATAHQWYGWYLSAMGRQEEAARESKLAQELDPLSLSINTNLGRCFYLARQYDRAIEQYQKTLEIDPNFWPGQVFLAKAYVQKGMYEEALAELQQAKGVTVEPRALIAYTYAVSGQRRPATRVLTELLELSKRQYVPRYHIAIIYAGLGDKDQAFAWLEKAYEERDQWLLWLKVEPLVDSLRSDPRFQDLLRRVGLPR